MNKPEGAIRVAITTGEIGNNGSGITQVVFYKTGTEPVAGTPASYDYNTAVTYDTDTNSTAKIYDCVTLDEKERYVIEEGAYLAYCPKEDAVNYNDGKFGNKAIAFQEATSQPGYQSSEVPTVSTKTDFTPHGDGLYVFRRSIVVNTEGNAAGTETFEYDGYYYLGGRYYKIMDLKVTHDDVQDVAAEGDTRDGQLKSATAYLVREEKVYDLEPKSFRYDAANNRIIASYATNTENGLVGDKDNLTELAAALDKAEHDLQQAEVRLERAIADSGIVAGSVKDKTTLTGDTAGKWQLLPTDINTNKEAVFYYTSILGAGEVSSQLIDYVELDKSVNQYMYKYFDFDLNVGLFW